MLSGCSDVLVAAEHQLKSPLAGVLASVQRVTVQEHSRSVAVQRST
ncbi:hypothetical protein SynMEDNS5_01860 [Synechococcus sp. MEDNS5]|nr:hypothetical protein SynMEDNS5_01860 [Synechococcus sp. MEDNS5]